LQAELSNLRKILEPIADRMIAVEEPGITPRDLHVAEGVIQYVSSLPPPLQKQMRQLILIFEYLPPVIVFRPRRFSRLNAVDQERYIAAWGTSRIGLLRTGFRVLKSLCVSTYYQNPAAWTAIGYRP
jgi:hypothetical protein